MLHEPLFTGVCTALVAPFRQDEVDLPALGRLTKRQLDAGVRCLLACGTTGESSTLTEEEWEKALDCVLCAAGDRAVVLAGTGTNSLRRTLDRSRRAKALGAHAQLVVTPYYNKTTQAGLIDYYTRLADAVPLPMVLYNVPARTGLNMLPETVAALETHPGIVGVKEAGGSLNQTAALLRLCHLPVYCGSDEIAAPALRLGASGVISVLSNLLPADMLQLCGAAARGCFRTADARQSALLPLANALFSEISPVPVKAALALLGLCRDEVRSPLVPVGADTLQRLRALLPAEACP